MSRWGDRRTSATGHNIVAVLISAVAFGLLEINFDPLPVSIDAAETAIDLNRFTQVASPMLMAGLIGQPAQAYSGSSARSVDLEPVEENNDRALAQRNVRMLEEAVTYLQGVSDYTATFYKRELVNGSMGEGQVMHLKLRHQPFSVYMKWIVGDKGRELLYVDGENDGNMLVKVGGIRGRLLPCIKLDPNGSMALRESRHPVTDVGLLKLTSMLLEHRRQELAAPEYQIRCRYLPNQRVDGCECCCFIFDFATPNVRPPYRRSVQFFEAQHFIPVRVMNYGWEAGAEPDEQALLEQYGYSDIRVNQRLADADFDRTNAKYSLRR
ncbi:MAG: DUF1571 domain-containing protein [Planctomycetaceae bacterium]